MNAYIEIIRPANGIMAAIAVAIGFVIALGGFGFTPEVGYAMVSAFLILSAGMAINDYYDWRIDAKHKKHRPIPSGRIKKKTAFVYAIVLFGVGVVLAFFINMVTFAIASVAALLLFFYGKDLSKKAFTGNMVVAINTGLTFVFGASVAGNIFVTEVLVLSGMALFATLAREIYKSIQDIKEDAGVRETLPMKIGASKSTLIAAFALLTAIMLSPIPYWGGTFGINYLLAIALVDVGFLYTAFSSMKSKNFGREARYCKMLQAAALVAFLAGVF